MGTYRGLFGSMGGAPVSMPDPTAQTPSAAPKPDALKRIAGIFADFAAGVNGQPGPYLQMQLQRQRDAQREAEYQRHQADQFAQQKQMYDYKLANPEPVNNDTVNDYQFILQNLGADAAKQYLQNKANPPQYRQGPDGNFYRIDTPQGAQGLPPETLPADFNFGEGGPAPSAPGMFP